MEQPCFRKRANEIFLRYLVIYVLNMNLDYRKGNERMNKLTQIQ